MASYGTSFYDEDEDKAPWQALLGQGDDEPRDLTPPAPEPTPAERPHSQIQQDNDAWEALAGPEQHHERKGSDADILIAGLLDVVLNQGRNVPAMVQQKQAAEEHKRRMELGERGIGPRGGYRRPGGISPEQLALRERYAKIAEDRAGISRDREARLAGKLGTGSATHEAPPAPSTLADFAELSGAGGGLEAPPEPEGTQPLDDEGRTSDEAAIDEARFAVRNLDKPPRPGAAPAGGEGDGLTAYQRESLRLRERSLDQKGAGKGKGAAAGDDSPFAIPGWQPVKGVTPNKDNAKKAREIVDALGESEAYAQELETLSGQLGAKAKLGKLADVLGQDEAAKAIGEARMAHQGLLAAQRKLQNMGVPQKYELEMLTAAYPELDSVDGILRAGHVYASARQGAKTQASRRLKVYGYEPGAAKAAARTSDPELPGEAPDGDADRDDALGVTGGQVPDAPMGASRRTEKLRPEAQAALDAYQARKPASNPAVQQGASGGSMVAMVDPDSGVMKMVPADRVKEAEKRGLKRVQ